MGWVRVRGGECGVWGRKFYTCRGEIRKDATRTADDGQAAGRSKVRMIAARLVYLGAGRRSGGSSPGDAGSGSGGGTYLRLKQMMSPVSMFVCLNVRSSWRGVGTSHMTSSAISMSKDARHRMILQIRLRMTLTLSFGETYTAPTPRSDSRDMSKCFR